MNALLILNDGAGSLNGDKDAVSASAVIEAFAAEGVTVQLWNASSDELSESLKAAAATKPDTILRRRW